jgi:hypothetical protein
LAPLFLCGSSIFPATTLPDGYWCPTVSGSGLLRDHIGGEPLRRQRRPASRSCPGAIRPSRPKIPQHGHGGRAIGRCGARSPRYRLPSVVMIPQPWLQRARTQPADLRSIGGSPDTITSRAYVRKSPRKRGAMPN